MEIFVGTYAEAGGKGVYPLRFEEGKWTLGNAFHGAQNASFGAYSRQHRVHYLVDEQQEGKVGAYRRESGGWRSLTGARTGGREPCYVGLSPDEKWLALANYGSGSMALFRLDPHTGLIGDRVTVRQNYGRGPVADRQDGPHAHCAVFSPDCRWLFQTDLGTDQVLAFAFDAERGELGETRTAFQAPPGTGPRHLVFHPNRPLAVLMSELASTLTLLEVGDGTLQPRQVISTLPGGFAGESLGGHLAFDAAGTCVFVTNRGHDSIAAFAFRDGQLALLGHTQSGGKSPRFFLLLEDGRTMMVAHEEGNSIAAFDVQPDRTLIQNGEVMVPGPAFIFAG